MKLRSYQSAAVEAILGQFGPRSSTLLVMCTGGGKTVTLAHVIDRFPPCRVMVLAHREELIRQAAQKIEAVTHQPCGVEMAGEWTDTRLFDRHRVIVSSIQTQVAGFGGKGRMSRFRPDQFGLVIIDEAHRAVASSYRRVIQHYRQNPDCKLLGVTATPDRSDEKALADVFDTCAFEYGILDAIEDGWLVPISQSCVKVEGLDFSSVRTTAGDLNGTDLARVMEYEENLHRIADPTLRMIGQRKTIVFAASVAHAERLCEIFNRHRGGCAQWLCGKTPRDQRQQLLRDFGAGRLQIVVNVGVLTEGYDEPTVEVVVQARPSKSRSLYAQTIGRGTRPLPGLVDGIDTPEGRRAVIAASAKPRLEVIDFVGNAGRHKLVGVADVLAGKRSDEVVERARVKAAKAGRPVDVAGALDEAEREVHLEREAAREAQRLDRRKVIATARYSTYSVNPFDVLHIEPVRVTALDRHKPLTENQVNFLERQGVDTSRLSFAEASQLIGQIKSRFETDRCSFKQARLLEQYGHSSDVSRAEASTLIDRIKANGWRKTSLLEEVTTW